MDKLKNMYNEITGCNKLFRAKTYSDTYMDFYENYRDVFERYIDMAQESGTDSAVDEAAGLFVKDSATVLSKGTRLPSGRKLAELNMFMVTYVIPGILKTDRRYSRELAEAICTKWGTVFKNSRISCGDYETINSGFKRSIFSIFGQRRERE